MNYFLRLICMTPLIFSLLHAQDHHGHEHEQADHEKPIDRAETEATTAIEAALLGLQTDIRHDTESLNALRARIETEREPLATRLEALRDSVAERRSEVEQVRRIRIQRQQEWTELEARAKALEEEQKYLRSLFSEYGRAMDTRMNAARHPVVMEGLKSARAKIDGNTELDVALRGLLAVSTDWNRDRVGGMTFPGAALDEAGLEHSGAFATFGPVATFASEAPDGPVGLAVLRFGADRPAVYDAFSPETLSAIRTVAEGGQAEVPVDPTGGDAIRVAEANPSLVAHLKQGGFTMIPLAGVAIVALLLALWKSIELARMGVKADNHVTRVVEALRKNDPVAARSHATAVRRPLRRLIDDLIDYREAPREHLEEILHEHVLASLPNIERNLGALAVLGGVAPLLGLLGTVTGMIHTFQLVTLFGSGDAKLLSGGISEALVTTETGLAIAIPTLLVHAFLARRARGIVASLETQAATLVNDLKIRTAAS